MRVHPEAYAGWKRKTDNRIIIRRYSLVSYRNIGKFIRELCEGCVSHEYTLNADFDGKGMPCNSFNCWKLLLEYNQQPTVLLKYKGSTTNERISIL